VPEENGSSVLPFREVVMTTLHQTHRFQPMWPGTWRWTPIAVAILVLAVILAILEFLLSEPVYAA